MTMALGEILCVALIHILKEIMNNKRENILMQ
jgi:hypothetical protein